MYTPDSSAAGDARGATREVLRLLTLAELRRDAGTPEGVSLAQIRWREGGKCSGDPLRLCPLPRRAASLPRRPRWNSVRDASSVERHRRR
jgi:hypothetical protein